MTTFFIPLHEIAARLAEWQDVEFTQRPNGYGWIKSATVGGVIIILSYNPEARGDNVLIRWWAE